MSRPSASLVIRTSAIRGRGGARIIRWCISWPRCCGRRWSGQGSGVQGSGKASGGREPPEAVSHKLMLVPDDYSDAAIADPLTRQIMAKTDFRHGGPEYDAKYPDGIPTTLEIEHRTLGKLSSGLVMYPEGHAQNTSGNLAALEHKFRKLAGLGVEDHRAATADDQPRRQIGGRSSAALQLRDRACSACLISTSPRA